MSDYKNHNHSFSPSYRRSIKNSETGDDNPNTPEEKWLQDHYLAAADPDNKQRVHDAIRTKDRELVSSLFNNPWQSVIERDNLLRTIVHTAVTENAPDILNMLIQDIRMDINAVDYDGNSAAMLAAAYHHNECLAILLSHKNINLAIKNNHEQTLLDIAEDHQNKAGAEMIRQRLISRPSPDSDTLDI